MAINFEPEQIECSWCGETVIAPDGYYERNGKVFCCAECIGEYVFKHREDFGFKYKKLLTAEQQRDFYGDMQYDRYRDNQLTGD